MLPRGFLILLCMVLAGLGAWAGNRYYENSAQFLNVGSLSIVMKYHNDAYQLSQSSFAVLCGLLCAAIPLSALIAGRFRSRANYLGALLTSLVIALGLSIAALLFYRHEISSAGQKIGEFFALMRDSKREIIFNPLNRSLLFAIVVTLMVGVLRGFISPVSGKK
ncbi:MAG TPA: hypothetical protein VGH19_19220 [Verrucomicrobiae bacterium]